MRLWGRLRHEERGISAVVAAISIVGLFGALVLSLDAGNLWSSKRAMVTATDAGALVGARTAESNGITTIGPCPQVVQDSVTTQMTANQPTATLDACTLNPSNSKSGYITVDARKVVGTRFAGIFGFGDQSAFSSTSVAYGFPSGVTGLRPMGICILNDHVKEWVNLQNGVITQAQYDALRGSNADHPVYAGAGVVHRILYTKQNAQSCGSSDATGNWGWQDYNNGNNQTNDIRDWIQNGYSGVVGIHKPVPVCPQGTYDEPNGCVNGNTGSQGTSVDNQLQYLVDNHIHFAVPLFDAAVTGGGNTSTFTIRAFLGLVLWGFNSNGSESQRYLDVEFTSLQVEGLCCNSNGTNTGVFSSTICSTDHDPVSTATRCTPAS
ncbi:MAG: hypothetical protein E6G04_05900 [Actinobacteria bacterium]|nr:MAG: hypothetical protein E6G04_05900 [Actinomycetota bacterium]